MTAGFLLGSVASVAFAITDFTASFVARKFGSTNAVLGTMLVSAVALFVYAVVFRQSLFMEFGWFLRSAILGITFALAYFNLFYALSLGPLVVVGPITGTFGVATVVFAMIFLGERPSPFQLACVPLAGIGSILASVVFDSTSEQIRLVGRGPLFAIFAVLFSAAVTVSLQAPVRAVGWLPTLFVLRLGGAATAVVFLLALSVWSRDRHQPSEQGSPSTTPPLALRFSEIDWRVRWLIPGVLLVGLADTVGLGSQAAGLAVAPAWLVGLVTSTSPVLLTLLGLLVLRERLRTTQWVGVALVIVALIAINVA